MNRLAVESAVFKLTAVLSLAAPASIAFPHLLNTAELDWPALIANLVVVAVATVAMIVAHEAGHAGAAGAVGALVYRIDLGFGQVVGRLRVLGIDVRIRQLPIGGLAFVHSPDDRALKARLWFAIAVGPLVNVAIAWLLVVVAAPEHTLAFLTGKDLGTRVAPLEAFALANVWIVAISILPIAELTDGRSLLRLTFLRPQQRATLLLVRDILAIEDLREERRIDEAETRVRALLAEHADSPVVLNSVALIELERGRYADARATFRRLLEHELDKPTRAVARNNIAWSSLFLDPPEALAEAEEHALAAWKAFPRVPAIRGTLGAVLVSRGKAERGIRHLLFAYPRATTANQQAELTAWMALAQATLGKREQADAYLARARALDPHAQSLRLVEATLAAGGVPRLEPEQPDE